MASRRWTRLLLCEARDEPTQSPLHLTDGPSSKRPTNEVVTSRYTLVNFLPKGILLQFRHLTNVFFLGMFVVAALGQWTNLFDSPLPALGFMLSLLLVVGINLLFEGLYDYGRHKQDSDINNRATKIYDRESNVFVEKKWKDVRPGDLLKISKNETVPADVLILYSDAPSVYVETASIDGETNLKVRRPALKVSEDEACLWRGNITYDPPSALLRFAATIDSTIPCGFDNVLLRGSVLKNTPFVLGLCVYAGVETKVVQSTNNASTKISQAQVLTNYMIVAVLLVGLVIVVASAAVSTFNTSRPWYLYNGSWFGGPGPLESRFSLGWFGSNFFTFVVLYSNLVPIALLICVTISNFFQAMFISWDLEMVYNDKPAKVNTLDLVQEIGQVNFLFSDKTGTLTRNEMRLVGVSVCGGAGVVGGGFDVVVESLTIEEIFSDLDHDDVNIQRMFVSMALCNTVLKAADGAYDAEGPDELAFVEAASKLGYELCMTEESARRVEYAHSGVWTAAAAAAATYKVVAVNAFTSERKRMSTIIQTPDSSYYLLVKGADSAVFPLVAASQTEEASSLAIDVDGFAKHGYRTLVFAYKQLSESEVLEWMRTYDSARQQLSDSKSFHLAKAAAEIECELTLIGASAVEDRLQEGVPETLSLLKAAGIKTWVLTGDKTQTAVNIAYSSKLFDPDAPVVELLGKDAVLRAADDGGNGRKLSADGSNLTSRDPYGLMMKRPQQRRQPKKPRPQLIVDGDFLEYSLAEQKGTLASEERFVQIAKTFKTVVASRCAPKQKALLVRAVARHVRSAQNSPLITLAVGDGANDVAMIQEARVGVGMYGHEGAAAVNASDFAVGRFRHLSRLLLVHGRWNYRRIASVILFIFYSNLTLVLTQFFYNFVNGWSGASLYDQFLLILWGYPSGIPIVIVNLLNKDLSEKTVFKYPQVYLASRDNLHLGDWKIAEYVVKAIFHAAIVCGICFLGHPDVSVDWLTLGTTVFYSMLSIVLARTLLETHDFTLTSVAAVAIAWTSFLWVEWIVYESNPLIFTLYGGDVLYDPRRGAWVWSRVVLASVSCIVLDVSFTLARKMFVPNDHDFVCELDRGYVV